jgi:hypothetical protein
MSGLTNTYIRDMEQGKTINVSRERLIALAFSMDLTLNETDVMLNQFDRIKLSEEDIPIYINLSSKIRPSSVLHPSRDIVGYELLLLGAEISPGPKDVVTNYPTAVLFAEGYRSFSENDENRAHPLYHPLIETIGLERKRNLTMQLARHRMDHYIGQKSLKRYLLGCNDPAEKSWRYKNTESLIWYLKNYKNFHYFITSIDCGFAFTVKYSEAKAKAKEVFFAGHASPDNYGKLGGQLMGFYTVNEAIVNQFKRDIKIQQNHVLDEYRDREKLVSYLETLVAS